ncbi:YibE/F family protein [Desulforamulus ruminis]|uniref:YibE/F family protein n=1 Tax=Desulforamulus ruminis TaxID=1564 RepID=UPI002FDA047B
MRKFVAIYMLVIASFFIFSGQASLASEADPQAEVKPEQEIVVRAKVLKVSEGQELPEAMDGWTQGKEQLVTVKVLSGTFAGEEIKLSHVIPDQPGLGVVVKPGDEVVLSIQVEGNTITSAFVSDHARDKKLYYLAGLFAVLMVLIGRMKGLKSVFSLILTGVGIFYVLLPMLFKGHSPILATVLLATVMTTITMVLVHGLNYKTLAGIIGTTCGVVVAGLLALLIGKAAYLTGFSSEEMQMLLYIPQKIAFDYQGLLFAGMIIGALGAVMDVSISIASAIEEIKRVNPLLGTKDLFRSGMNVGGDIMGTMANTLILAYTGGAIPLILIFMAYEMPYLKMINLDLIATEIVRALTGSIGLIMAIPITSMVAGLLFNRVKRKSAVDSE